MKCNHRRKYQMSNFKVVSEKNISDFLKMAKKGILVVAVTDIEKEKLFDEMKPTDGYTDIVQIPYKNNTYYLGKIGVQNVVALICGMGAVGRDSVMNKVHEAVDILAPKVLIMVGIAFGLDRKKQRIGDVLVSQKIIAYENQKFGKENTIHRGDVTQSGTILYDRLKNANSWKHNISPQISAKRFFGTILSGEKLFDNQQKLEALKAEYPEAIGGEMEGYGLASVASFKGIKEWVVIKGICDWGYDKQGRVKDRNQRKAMDSAMSLCTHILSNKTYLEHITGKQQCGEAKRRFNSYKMFYYRAFKHNISIKQLKNLTGISEYRLKKLEKIDLNIQNEIIDKFPLCSDKERTAIEKALSVKQGGLIISKKDIEVAQYKSYYDKNKGVTPIMQHLNTKKNAKIVVLDFDGTIVDAHALKTTWEKIWLALGYDVNCCKELHARFDRGEFSHQKWCDITAEYFKEKKLSFPLLKELSKDFKILPGFFETIKKLQNEGVKLFIVSGSIREIIVEILQDNANLFESIDANKFVFDKDEILERIIGTEYDFEGKARRVEKISEEYGISTDEILFIGNSFNDAHVYKSGARTLCVNATHTNSHNQLYWHDSIDEMHNFEEILPYVFPNNKK